MDSNYPHFLVSDPRCIEAINSAVGQWARTYYQQAFGWPNAADDQAARSARWNQVVQGSYAAGCYTKRLTTALKNGVSLPTPTPRQAKDGVMAAEQQIIRELVGTTVAAHVERIREDLEGADQLEGLFAVAV